MSSILKQQKGFTILELMIATSIFSVVLLLCTFGIINIGRIYYKGIVSSRTQATARAISDDIVQAIQYGGLDIGTVAMPTPTATASYGTEQEAYIGNRHYTFVMGKVFAEGGVGIKVESIDGNRNPIAGTQRELLNSGMWLSKLEVAKVGKSYAVNVQIVSGDLDQVEDSASVPLVDSSNIISPTFDLSTIRCKPESGSQFCSVSGLYTQAAKRL